MKRGIWILFVTLLLVGVLVLPVSASDDLDRILSYDVTVVPNNDASLEMSVAISWKVLDSTSEGPLTWVKIGIPNTNVSGITADSNNIRHIERNGEYIEVYFTGEYHAGDTVDFSFSWHQTHMFMQHENGTLDFVYTPGWFDESVIDVQTIRWSKLLANTYDLKTEKTDLHEELSDSDWIVYTAHNVQHGGKMTLTVQYPSKAFPTLDPEMNRGNAGHDYTVLIVGILAVTLLVVTIAWVIWYRYRTQRDPGYWTGGYEDGPVYSNPSHFWFWYGIGHSRVPYGGFAPPPGRPGDGGHVSGGQRISSGGSSAGGMHGGGGGCACACACACAGGGRAGCSRKDIVGAGADLSQAREAFAAEETAERKHKHRMISGGKRHES